LGEGLVNAQAWRLRAVYGLRRLGLPGAMGALCLLALLAFLLLEARPAAQRVAGFAKRQAALQQRAALQAAPDGVARTPGQQLLAFYEDFPVSAEIADVLAGVHAIAQAQQLSLDLGEYAVVKTPGARLDRVRITLPLKGGYPQLRQLVFEALRQYPALALESLSLRRDKVSDEVLDGRLVFMLYVEHGA
jgi:hypothetical protein